MSIRGYNFGAGPAMLPEHILQIAQNELLNWQQSGMSVMEIGHRTAGFTEMMQQAEQGLRRLLSLPDDYHVLFLGGAARSQFAMIAMNFLNNGDQAGYLISGFWSEMAFKEACHLYPDSYIACSLTQEDFKSPLPPLTIALNSASRYFYYTPNETINGVRLKRPTIDKSIPVIADMTSCLLSEPIQINDYDLIFAGAQKNIANAGLTLVIVSDTLLKTINKTNLPTMFDYRTHVRHHSLYATPPTFNCYLALKMFEWLEQQGGVAALYQQNCEKAEQLYAFIDSSTDYYCDITPAARSITNVCFRLVNPAIESLFLEKAQAQGLYALKGHREVGGLRASLYNAMPLEGVVKLINFMNDFARTYAL